MKKKYDAPQMEIISIEIEDVVLADSGLKMNYEQGIGMGDDDDIFSDLFLAK